MKIYKIVKRVTEYNRRKDKREYDHKEEIVIDKLEYAREIYKGYLQELQASFSYSMRGISRTGHVALFIPHVHKNGLLAYWPDNEKYILKQDFVD